MLTDPIADFLNRLKNASLRNHETVSIPSSRIKVEIVKVLEHAKLVAGFELVGKGRFPKLVVKLIPETPLSLTRVSKPGRRVYVGVDGLRSVRSGLGIQVVSTPQGVMSNKQARAQGLGGEVLCEAYAQ